MFCPVVTMSLKTSMEIEKRQNSKGAFVLPTILYSIKSMYVFRECMRRMPLTNFGLWCPLPFNSSSKGNFNNASENLTQIRITKCQTRFSIWEVNLNSLRSSRHFDCDGSFCVVVSVLNEHVYGFHKFANWMVQTVSQIISFCRVCKFCSEKHINLNHKILVHWWVGFLWNWNLHLPLQIQLLRRKLCKGTKCIVWNKFRSCIIAQLLCSPVVKGL